MGSRKPLAGYNHNFRYKTRVFHVQSEDSGVENPHIFTHIFLDGMIISSGRTDYKDLADKEGHEPAVRKLMQKQHKELMKKLRRGDFDDKIIELAGSLKPAEDEVVAAEVPATAEISVDAEVPAAAEISADLDVPAGADVEMPAMADVEMPAAADVEIAAEVPAAAEVEVTADAEVEEIAAPAAAEVETPVAPATATPVTAAPAPPAVPDGGDEAILAAAEAVIQIVSQEEESPAAPRSAPPAAVEVDVEAHDTTEFPAMPKVEPPLRPLDTEPDGLIAGPSAARAEKMSEVHEVYEEPEVPEVQALPPETQPGGPDVELEITQFLNVDRLQQQSRARRAGLPIDEDEVTQPVDLEKLRRQRDEQRASANVSVVVDDPAPDGEEPDPARVRTPSYYSHVYRERLPDAPESGVRAKAPEPRQPSRVFRKPLPGAPRLPTPAEALPELNPIKPRRSGVYLVPGGPPQRPPHPDPSIRRQSRPPSAGPRYSSSPQQYTAPSRAAVTPKRKRRTGSYEEIPAHQPPRPTGPTSSQHAVRTARTAQPLRSPARPPAQPPAGPPAQPPARPPAQPPARPPGRPPATPPPIPTAESSQDVVVARPAVIISQPVHVGPKAKRPRPTSTPVKPLPQVTPRPPTVPSEPAELKEPKRGPEPPRATEPPSVFGSDLISERSLDEVILAYLAEDSEASEE